jgi:hypothetical protein
MALANLRRINRWADRSTMLRGLIVFCLLRRALVLIAFAAFLGLGLVAFTALNIEAYPDPAPPIVEIIAQRPGQSPEEMERYVTIPIEIAIASTPGVVTCMWTAPHVIRLTTITLRHFGAGERAPSTTPKSAVSDRSKAASLFDHLVRAREQRRGGLWLKCNARQDSIEKCHSCNTEVLDLAAKPDQIH